MSSINRVTVFEDRSAACDHAATVAGLLLGSPLEETSHLPFAALVLAAERDDEAATGSTGCYRVIERAIKGLPLLSLNSDALPVYVGIFPMVARPDLGSEAADRHWREQHAPLALEVHELMSHYYQLAVQERVYGPDWHGIALCCFNSEDDLRNRFFCSKDGQTRIRRDVEMFADTRSSPRRVVATAERFL